MVSPTAGARKLQHSGHMWSIQFCNPACRARRKSLIEQVSHEMFSSFSQSFQQRLNIIRIQRHILLSCFCFSFSTDIEAHVCSISHYMFSSYEVGHHDNPCICCCPFVIFQSPLWPTRCTLIERDYCTNGCVCNPLILSVLRVRSNEIV